MGVAEALIDTNVLVAAAEEVHQHHAASFSLLQSRPRGAFAVSVHILSETYSTLTRRNAASRFHWEPAEAWAAIDGFAARMALVGLTPGQTFDAIRVYAAGGGVGPRLYDHLIGHAAVMHGIPRIVTWNVNHMRGLFPALDVAEPPPLP